MAVSTRVDRFHSSSLRRGATRTQALAALLAILAAGGSATPLRAQGTATPPTIVQVPVLGGGAAPASGEAKKEKDEDAVVGTSFVTVSDRLMVDVIVQNDTINNVLQKLAVQTGRNIVPSPAVDRRIHATMYRVPFEQALEGLLEPNGLGYIEKGEFLFVYTAAELAQIQRAQEKRVSRIFHLSYLRSEDARDFVQHLLSDTGKIEATKDLAAEGGGGGGESGGGGGGEAGGGTAGSSLGGDEDEVYTPEIDEYALASAIIVHDYEENVLAIERFLADVDQRPPQVLLECSIVQTTLSEQNAYGIDFALLSGVNFVDFFTAPINGANIGFKNGVTLPSDEGFIVNGPGNVGTGAANVRMGGIINDEIGVFLRALDQVTDVTLLSNPKVLALNRQRAFVQVGTNVGYLETTVVENQVLQTVKFIDTGILLDIRPYILANGQIRLELKPKVSNVAFREVQGVGGAQQVPDENIQTITTDVLVPAGHTAVLGGLFREDTSRSRSQTPLLGDVPYLGGLFRGQDDDLGWVEIIFMIKPTVVHDDMLIEDGERGLAYEERVRVGSRLGLLPWSRERMSSCHNLAAEGHAANGDMAAALWDIRRSLELHPQQPEVLRMRQGLVAGPDWWSSRSYLRRVIDGDPASALPPPMFPAGE